jgi:hypothetical protein
VDYGSVLGRHVRGVENVFDTDGHAMEQTNRFSLEPQGIHRACLLERIVGIEKRPGLNLRVDLAYPRQASLDKLFGTDQAVSYQPRGFSGRD